MSEARAKKQSRINTYERWREANPGQEIPRANPDVLTDTPSNRQWNARHSLEYTQFLEFVDGRAFGNILTPNQIKAVLLYIHKGLSYEGVSKEMSLSKGRVVQLVKQAGKNILKLYQKEIQNGKNA